MSTLDVTCEACSAPLLEKLDGPGTWTAHDVRESSWRFELPQPAIDEIRTLADRLRRNPVPTMLLDPTDYELPVCRPIMADVKRTVFDGVRFAVVDRLPLDEIGDDIGVQIYWLLCNLVCRPVAQKLDGTMLYDVKDYGRPPTPGSGVRPAQTNLEQAFHNDNAYSRRAPEVVSLMCLQPSRTGGVSRTISLHTVHNRLLERHPTLLSRLYQAFGFDRQREFWPGESPIFFGPIFRFDGKLAVRLSTHQLYSAYKMRDLPIPEPDHDALNALKAVCEEPDLALEFSLQRGEIEFVNNRETGHARTAFQEYDEPGRRRHLVRIWQARQGARSYNGD